MRSTVRSLAVAVSLLPIASASANAQLCRVEAFQGATSPQGATTRMRVVNTGAACSVSNYGLPASQANPADSGSITSAPSHGSATFIAPRVSYTPASGYVGDDEFTYEAFATGAVGQRLLIKVRVQVSVVSP